MMNSFTFINQVYVYLSELIILCPFWVQSDIQSDVDPNFSVNNSLLVLGSSFKDAPIGVLQSVLQSEVASLVKFEQGKNLF